MQDKLKELRALAQKKLESADSLQNLSELHATLLGRKGALQALMQELKNAKADDRPQLGKQINELKIFVESAFEEAKNRLERKILEERLSSERLDTSLPAREPSCGGKHPVLAMLDRMVSIFSEMGFAIAEAPHIERDYYNFEGLNYPPDHPARDMQDTFYITPDLLLRTHTTTIQGRIMETAKPPIRIVCPGKCFRNEEINARSHVFFHQIDGLYIDEKVTLPDLLSTLEEFYKRLFGWDIPMRFRASYFPFVEPGVEVDCACLLCKGKGCSVCKYSGWLEVAGAGMVHPEILKSGGVDPDLYSGFAWGMGVERVVMLQHGINDIRLFTQNDLRFLRQFA